MGTDISNTSQLLVPMTSDSIHSTSARTAIDQTRNGGVPEPQKSGPTVMYSKQKPEVSPASGHQSSSQKHKSVVSLDQIKSATAQGNAMLQDMHRNLEFQVDKATKEFVVKIIDSETGKLVRQIPSEEMLKLTKILQEENLDKSGFIIKDRA